MNDTDDLIARAEAALKGVTPGPHIVTEKMTQIGKCYWVKAQAHADLKHGGAILYDDDTSLNPHAPGEVKANAYFYAAARELVSEMKAHIAAQAAEIERLRAERPGLWAAGRDAAAQEVQEWRDLPSVPPGNERAEVYNEACDDMLRYIRALTPPDKTEGPQTEYERKVAQAKEDFPNGF